MSSVDKINSIFFYNDDNFSTFNMVTIIKFNIEHCLRERPIFGVFTSIEIILVCECCLWREGEVLNINKARETEGGSQHPAHIAVNTSQSSQI